MRIAVLADIHGNMRALEAVQADLMKHAPDMIVNLGDHLPAEMGLSDEAAHGQLSEKHKEWLAGLPPKHVVTEDIFLCHGSPDDDLEYLLENVVEGFVQLGLPNQIRNRLGNL